MKQGGSRVVIAGGGVAGHRIAFALRNEAQVTLVDPKEFFEIPMAVPRLLVEPARGGEAIIPYAAFLPGVRLVRGRVDSVEPGFVFSEGVQIPFDYLVLATGAAYSGGLIQAQRGSATERRAHFHDWAERICQAKRILIVGGGPVGVEVAGEILEDLPGKELTLVHSGPTLLPGVTPGPQAYALAFLRRRGAQIILGQEATSVQIARADLTLRCAGSRPGSACVAVDEFLRKSGTSNIFAAGDVTDLPEAKLGLWAGKHAAVVIENIRRLLRGENRLKRYRPATGNRTMLVTLGRNHGTGHIPLGDFTNSWFARTVKSRDVFIGRYRKALGLT